MNFIVLLLVLWVEKFSDLRRRVQRDGPWRRALARLEAREGLAARSWLMLLVLVLARLGLLGLLLWLRQPSAYGWRGLPSHLVVVPYTLGRGDVKAALGASRDA